MDGLNGFTAAPWRQTIDGEVYEFSPLTLQDWGHIEQRITERRPHPLDEAKSRLDGLSDADKRALLEKALTEATTIHRVNSQEMSEYLAGYEGTALMFWLSLRRRHAEVTESQAAELLDRLGTQELRTLQGRIDGTAGIPGGSAKN